MLEAVAKKTVALKIWISKSKMFVLTLAKHLQQCIDDRFKDAYLDEFVKLAPIHKPSASGSNEAEHVWVADVIGR
jgi:hypothetical protein